MSGKQHTGVGTVGSLGVILFLAKVAGIILNPLQSSMIVIGSVLGSLMPDIDSKKSKASQLFNKVLFYIIISFAGLNLISGFVDVQGLNGLFKNIVIDSFFGSFGMVLFIVLVVAGKLSPHRGFTHKWLGTLSFCLSAVITFESYFAFGFIVGYLLHIVADRFTKKGKDLNFFEFRLPCQNSKGAFKPVF